MLTKFIGDRKFYKRLFAISVPIMLQSAISNFVSLLDNIMVGRIGTEQMSGVAVANQLFFVFFLMIFGGMSGAGIFTAQYFGKGDDEGVRNTFRYKIWIGSLLTVFACLVFYNFGHSLIALYMNSDTSLANVGAASDYGKLYMRICMLGLPGFAMTQMYSGTLRDCGKTTIPMVAGIGAVLTNLVFDVLLIFGIGPFPALGVAGAAIATVIARYVEVIVVVSYSHSEKAGLSYIKGLYRTLRVPGRMVAEITIKGMPLLMNETLWSIGMAILLQCYSLRGLEVVAGMNITNTVSNVVNITFFSMGDAVAIIVGQLLGAGKMEEAKDADNKIIAFAIFLGVISGFILAGLAFEFPKVYNTSAQVKEYARYFLLVQAVFTPQIALIHTTYFTLRSGGKTIITFFFDCGFVWAVTVPTAFILSRFTTLSVVLIFVIVNMADWIKCTVGIALVRKNAWMNDLTEQYREVI